MSVEKIQLDLNIARTCTAVRFVDRVNTSVLRIDPRRSFTVFVEKKLEMVRQLDPKEV